MSGRTSRSLLLRALVLGLGLLGLAWCADLTALVDSGTDRGAYAWFQGLACVAFVAGFVLIALSRRTMDLPLPFVLFTVAAGLQFASAWMGVSVNPRTATPAAISAARTKPLDPDVRTVIQAAITALCGLALFLHAMLLHRRPEERVPFRRALRQVFRADALNPFAVLFGPVFQKEVRVSGRSRGTYAARFLVPVLLVSIVGVTYWGQVRTLSVWGGWGGGAQRLQQLQQLAPLMAIVMAWVQFALLVFIAPVLTSSGICDERRARTLSALMTTPMTSAQIIGGKLTSRMVQVFVLALVAAPLLLGIRIFGGLEARIVVATTAVTLSAAMLAAALGLMYSIWHRRAATAAVFALLTLVAFSLVPISIMVAAAFRTSTPPEWLSWTFAMSPPVAMAGITAGVMAPAEMGLDLDTIWIASTCLNLALAAIVSLFATAALRKVLWAEAAGALVEERPRRKRRRRAAGRAAGTPAPEAEGEPVGEAVEDSSGEVYAVRQRLVGDHPVLWREFRQAAFGSRNRLIALAAVVAVGLAWLYMRLGLFDESLLPSVAIAAVLTICVHSALTTTGTIAAEREARTWDVLLTTPITPMEIIFSKFMGGLRRQWFTAAILAIHCGIAVGIGAVRPVTCLHLAFIIIGASVFLNGTGMFFSVWLRRSAAAAVCNLALALAIWIVLPIAVVLFIELFRFHDGQEDVATPLVAINPVAMTAIACNDVTASRGGRFPSLTYDMPHGRMGLLPFTFMLAFTSCLGVAAGVGSALLGVWMFGRRSGRVS